MTETEFRTLFKHVEVIIPEVRSNILVNLTTRRILPPTVMLCYIITIFPIYSLRIVDLLRSAHGCVYSAAFWVTCCCIANMYRIRCVKFWAE